MCAWVVTAAGLACALALGCGEAHTTSSLQITESDGGGTRELQARWSYRSTKVDVDIRLLTALGDADCNTSAQLRLDEAVAGTTVYRMPETDCAEVRLTETGDLVLFDAPTGHDWTAEAIDVDTDRELIRLGPWRDEQRDVTYRFTLSSPACDDNPFCQCPHLDRNANGEVASLLLERSCD